MQKNTQVLIPSKPFNFIRFSSRPYKIWIFLALISVILAAGISTYSSYLFRKIIDTATIATTEGMKDVSPVMWWVIIFVFADLVRAGLYRLSGVTGARWITGIEANGYKKLFEYMTKHSQSFFDNRFAGAIVNNIFNATRSSSEMVESILWNYLTTLIRFCVSIFLIYTTNIWVALIFMFWFFILIPINYFLAKNRKEISETEASLSSELRGKSVDSTANIGAVHQYARTDWETARLDELIDKHQKVAIKSWYMGEAALSINNVLIACFVLSTLIFTFTLWRDGTVTIGTFVMIITLVSGITDDLTFIGASMNRFGKNYGEVNKGLSEIIIPHEIVDVENATEIPLDNGEVNFDTVGFWYNEKKNILSDFTLKVKSGERIGIVGQSGAGKTTLIKLLLRQHEVKAGNITINGENINNISLDSLRKVIGIVPQEPLLFHRTIRENIAYGKSDATQEEIEQTAKLAQAHSFIESLPEKYDTLVGDRGVKLSAGQRQRIAIARAILKDAPILILDEATSALDSESEVLIQKALEELMKGKTVFAVAHRLSTLSEMTKLIVMENGKIIEEGTHTSLLKNTNGLYKKLWDHQSGGFIPDEE